MAADNDLLALYVRLGMLAIERFADRTNDTFIVSDRELPRLTGKYRADVARTLLERLADVSPTCVERDGDVWRITIPNLAKKQGFAKRLNTLSVSPSSSSSTATSTQEEEKRSRAKRAPRPRSSNPKTICPDELTVEQSHAVSMWAADQGIDLKILKLEWQKHRSFWQAERKLRADWRRSFENWLLKAVEFAERDAKRDEPRESAAQGRERRTKEAAAEAFRQMAGDIPPLLALQGGRS